MNKVLRAIREIYGKIFPNKLDRINKASREIFAFFISKFKVLALATSGYTLIILWFGYFSYYNFSPFTLDNLENLLIWILTFVLISPFVLFALLIITGGILVLFCTLLPDNENRITYEKIIIAVATIITWSLFTICLIGVPKGLILHYLSLNVLIGLSILYRKLYTFLLFSLAFVIMVGTIPQLRILVAEFLLYSLSVNNILASARAVACIEKTYAHDIERLLCSSKCKCEVVNNLLGTEHSKKYKCFKGLTVVWKGASRMWVTACNKNWAIPIPRKAFYAGEVFSHRVLEEK